MTRIIVGLALIVMTTLSHAGTIAGVETPGDTPPPAVCFTPPENCIETIVRVLAEAQSTIKMQAYYFTAKKIAAALLDAHKRGVRVDVILDKSQRSIKYSMADFLVNQGMWVWIDAEHAIAHDKIIIIDGVRVLTGSYNFTASAEDRNAENLVVLQDPALVAAYTQNWARHREHSTAYMGRGR